MQWRCGDRILDSGERPLVMGILNVTPDSFSDGGRYQDAALAVERGLAMADEGADILDIGGESTRPGAEEVLEAEEIARVLPVIEALVAKTDVAVSIDTTKAEVARQALGAGACIVNDVSACTMDPAMAGVVAGTAAGVVLMHMQGTPRTMQDNPQYGDVVSDVEAALRERVAALVEQGVPEAAIAVDPGIGFGKTAGHNVALLGKLRQLRLPGCPLLVGLSRKRFLGALTGREVEDRLAGSLAALVFCVLEGVDVMRVHDVKESCDAIKVAMALKAAAMERDGQHV